MNVCTMCGSSVKRAGRYERRAIAFGRNMFCKDECMYEWRGLKNKSHGHASGGHVSKTYSSWMNMRMRCRPTDKFAHRYYDRGIHVDPRWESFDAFLEDMGECQPGCSIDRINNDLGYTPGNCRWATPKQQAENSTRPTFIEFDGKRLCLSDWAELTGVSRVTIRNRLKRGLPIAEVLSVRQR